MGSIYDSIVAAVMEPAKAVAAGNAPAPAPAAKAPAAPAAAARPGHEAASRPAASVAAAVSAAVTGAATPSPASAPAPAPTAAPAPAAAKPKSPAEVEAMIAAIAASRPGTYNWKQSIVDLMKLLQLDSSLGARKQLAQELGYSGALDGSAEMNIWLHKQVMQRLATGQA